MKVGDLLYYRAGKNMFSEDTFGIALKVVEVFDGEYQMRTLWFDDWMYTEEPMPGSPAYCPNSVGVLSESR